MHGRAYKNAQGLFEVTLRVSDLSTYGLIDESNDDCWEIGFKVALDMNHQYILPFKAGVGFPNKADNAILKVKKLVPIL